MRIQYVSYLSKHGQTLVEKKMAKKSHKTKSEKGFEDRQH